MSDHQSDEPSAPDLPEDSSSSVGTPVSSSEPRPADAGLGGPVEQPEPDPNHPDHQDLSRGDHDPRNPGGELVPREVVAELVETAVDSAVREAVSVIGESFSGPVPQAKDLHAYTAEQQERIMRMAEAPRTDESHRRDLVVKAGIDSNKRSAIIQPLLFAFCLTGSALSFWVFDNDIAGAVFLSYPVLNFLAGVRWNVGRRDRTKQEDEI